MSTTSGSADRRRSPVPVPVVAVLAGIAGGLLLWAAAVAGWLATPYVIGCVVRWALARA